MEETAEKLADQWRVHNNCPLLESEHECSMETCNLQHIVGGVWKQGDNEHVCVRILCKHHPPWANRGTLKKQIRNIYMCCATGHAHFCNEQCSKTSVDHSDGGHVCRISGIRYDSINSDTWFNSHRVTATHQENKDPLKLVRDTAFEMDHLSSHTIRQQQHHFISKQQVSALLFSNERLFMEQRKYVEMKNEAEKVVQKYIKTCEKNQHGIHFTHIVQLYINQMNRRHIFRNLLPEHETVDNIIEKYAVLTCRFWSLMTRRFPLGQTTPALFPIKIFVVSILYIMKAGLNVGGVNVIKGDRYLTSVLPEANTLDAYNINKPAFTACKNNILKAYREAVEQYKMSPTMLCLS
jgi:hypothetical protein|tara:strand:+ start:770 stop:1822 length:1053 start_codon:yes stop_codon:yes gene_type:complete